MAALNVPFNGFTLSAQHVFGPQAVAAGRSSFFLTFDMSGFTAGQSVFLLIELSEDGGVTWPENAFCDFDGPYRNKRGQLITVGDLRFTLGQNPDLSQRVTTTQAQIRATLTPTNGPVAIGAGSIQVT